MMSARPSSMAMRSMRACSVVARQRTFSFTAAGFSLKESSTQSNVDYDRHKQDSLSKQKSGRGHWKPELASDSEEAVKADRAAEGAGAEEEMNRLQERTKRTAEETSKGGTSSNAGV